MNFVRPKYFQLMAIVAIIVGAILVAYPVEALSYIVIIIGALLVLAAASSMLEYYRMKNKNVTPSSSILLNSLVSMGIGALLIISPLFVIDVLVKILSIILLVASVLQLITFASMRSKQIAVPGYMFITPSILFIASLIMLFASIGSVATIIMMFGIGIILYAAVELISYYTIDKK